MSPLRCPAHLVWLDLDWFCLYAPLLHSSPLFLSPDRHPSFTVPHSVLPLHGFGCDRGLGLVLVGGAGGLSGMTTPPSASPLIQTNSRLTS